MNNKCLILSDLHFGVYKASSEWEQIHRNLFNKIIKEAIQAKCEYCFILGDVFHDKKEIGTNILKLANDFFYILSNSFKKIYILAGNHDFLYREDSSICTFNEIKSIQNKKIVKIIDKPKIFTLENKKIGILPWHKILKQQDLDLFFNNKYDLFFSHLPINDFNISLNIKEDKGFSLELVKKIANLSFHGHFHTYQQIENIVYIGAQLHLNKNDRNMDKFFAILDLDTLKFEKIKTNMWFPNFLRITSLNEITKDKNFKNAIVDLILPKTKIDKLTQKEYNEIESFFKKLEVASLKILFSDKIFNPNEDIVNINVNFSLTSILEQLITEEIKINDKKIPLSEYINYVNLLLEKVS